MFAKAVTENAVQKVTGSCNWVVALTFFFNIMTFYQNKLQCFLYFNELLLAGPSLSCLFFSFTTSLDRELLAYVVYQTFFFLNSFNPQMGYQ